MTIRAKVKKVNRNPNSGLCGLRRYLKTLTFNNVEVGFFEEAGIHPSIKNTQRWTYAQLMAFHELQVEFAPRRPIFAIASIAIRKHLARKLTPFIKNGLRKAIRTGSSDPTKVYDAAGEYMIAELNKIFGSSKLVANSSGTIASKGFNAPMIETGALQDALRYRNSKDKELKE